MTSDARKTLADFIQRELDFAKLSGEAKSEREWAAKHDLRPHDVRRARHASTGMSLDKLQEFASALGIDPWEMLFPGYVRGAPQFPSFSAEAISVAQEIDKIESDEQRRISAAAIVNLLGRAASAPSPTASPAEQPSPSHGSTRKPQRHR